MKAMSVADDGRADQGGHRVGVADVQFVMRSEHSIGQEVLRPTFELGHQVEIGTRVDVMRNASRNDREDGGGALGAEVEPREQPIMFDPKISLRSSRSRRLFVTSMLPSSKKRISLCHCRCK
jgi:hypothetical protein